MRDYMWARMKDWLLTGAIDTSPRLEADLTGPGLREDLQQRVWLESKKEMKSRGLDSPNRFDALALTEYYRSQHLRRMNTDRTNPLWKKRSTESNWKTI